jgi:hypothetical protein
MLKGPRDQKRFHLARAMPIFVVLAISEGVLIFSPSLGAPFVYWPQACVAGLCLLAAFAWYAVPVDSNAKGS